MDVLIRPASRQDEPALRTLDRVTWARNVSPAPRPDPERPFFGPDEPAENTLVAEMDGAVAGYIKLGPVTELESNQHVLYIRGLAVHPDHQGRGLGRKLLDAAAREAAARGARRLTLRVLAPNTAARALYESCGFEVEGILREEFLLDGRYVDDVLTARALPG